MYNVFTDFHHASLLQSFILLFEKRFGGTVFRPIGMEWATKGFWKVYDHPATQAQYLGIGSATPDGSEPLNEINTVPQPINYYLCHDIDSGQTNRAITFDGFMAMHFDYVIASLPQHIRPFAQLCELHPDRPKLIYQIGNQWNIEASDAHLLKGVMASARIVHNYPVPTIQYHQEFDITQFKPNGVDQPANTIASFVNCFDIAEHLQADRQLFGEIEKRMLSWKFFSYGGQSRDGALAPASVLAQGMQNTRFIWHTKAGGDGYGHILHNAAAVGRPLIVKKQYYHNTLGEELIKDEETALCIDNLDIHQIIQKIEFWNEPARYKKLCEATYRNFKEKVNFPAEAVQLKQFLSNLL